ncbi:hypothetical protein [Corynebacterium glutamicum]|nr:hypothetical protein [Corynebacterium glutamicum]
MPNRNSDEIEILNLHDLISNLTRRVSELEYTLAELQEGDSW